MKNTKRIRWNDQMIRDGIMEVVDALKLDRMPSKKECEEYFHNSCLTNAISKRTGWYNLANEMGLEIKESDTGFGKLFERKGCDLLRAKGFEVRRMSHNHPYDLLVDGCVKVDVKASKLYRGEEGNYYSFNLDKPYATCDFYLLLTVNDDDTINRRMVVPSYCVMSHSQISIGEHKSKYHLYTDRFDLLETAADFWGGIPDIMKKATS